VQINITARNVKLTKAIRDYVSKKVEKMTRFLENQIINVQIKLEVEKYTQIAEIKIHIEGHVLKAREVSTDIYAAIDLTIDKLERQVNKFKEIQKGHHKKHSVKEDEYFVQDTLVNVIEEAEKQDLKIFTPKQALNEMDASGRTFFAFLNSRTEKVNIIYRADKGANGLVELNY